MESQLKILNLEKEIRKASFLYYNQPGNVYLDDYSFDNMLKELKVLSPNSPVLKEIGAPTSDEALRHYRKMYSLDNAMNLDETNKFLSKFTGNSSFVASLKLDGASAELVYQDGELAQCSTRGDGMCGEPCPHLKSIVPINIDHPGILSVYGEVVIPRWEFDKVKDEYSSPRNLAAGALMTKDNPDILVDRGAQFVAYDAEYESNFTVEYLDILRWLDQAKFKVVPHHCIDMIELESIFLEFLDEREFNYEILGPSDGIVIRLSNIDDSKSYGYGEKAPKFAIAWKFPTEKAEVIVKNIRWDVSKNGRMTPVAEFDPVRLEGADISNCTMHNANMLSDNSVGIGGKILITRSGGVIPKFLKTIEKSTVSHINGLLCPSCKELVEWDDNGTYLLCTNLMCKAQAADRIESFFDKLDFKGFGEAICKLMVEYGVANPGMVFQMERVDYASILGFSEWHADEVYQRVQKLKVNMNYQKFIYALGIDMVGNRYSKKIAEKVSVETFKAIIDNDYTKSKHWYALLHPIFISSITTGRIANSFNKNRKWILELLMSGVVFKENKMKTNNSISFVITGTLSKPRKEFQDVIEKAGYEYQGSLTKNTKYLVAGSSIGANKIAKATKYGTEVISEKRFWEIVK